MSKKHTQKRDESGVQLPVRSASGFLYSLLEEAKNYASASMKGFSLPEKPGKFASSYHKDLSLFEAVRARSPSSKRIALALAEEVQDKMLFVEDDRKISLADHFNAGAAPFDIEVIAPPARPEGARGYKVEFPLLTGGFTSDRNEIEAEIYAYTSRNLMTPEAAEAFVEMADKGRIDLAGQKFVLLGGMAELSPLKLLLKAGADVMTTHLNDKDRQQLIDYVSDEKSAVTGRLFLAREPMDLLKNPARIAATAAAFAGDEPVHLGLFAYKGGQAREWRLAAAQDGIARSLNKNGFLKSYTCYLSPSVPTQVSKDTAYRAAAANAKKSQYLSTVLGNISASRLCMPNIVRAGERYWAGEPVPMQGASYAAANLIGKTHAIEHFAATGVRVSANVAPITNTASMNDPMIQRAFNKVADYGIKIFEPEAARTLMFLQMAHDLTCAEEKHAQNPASKHVHGGVFTAPYNLDSCMNGAVIKSFKPW